MSNQGARPPHRRPQNLKIMEEKAYSLLVEFDEESPRQILCKSSAEVMKELSSLLSTKEVYSVLITLM